MFVNARTRRIVIALSLICLLYFSRNKLNQTKPISSINTKLTKYSPWKIFLSGYTFHYFLSHALSIFGFGPRDLPENHYHPDFVKLRKVFTGLDAGIISSLHIQTKWLRDIFSIILGAYFIIFSKKAEDRMHRFHQHATVCGVRACWTKGRHPLLWNITKLKERYKFNINIHRREIVIDPLKVNPNNPKNQNLVPIYCYLYFQGTEQQLAKCRHVVINYPGGGFVTMNHLHHESYIQKWANYLHIPVISVNYRKAPENPYPDGFNDAYYTYKSIVETNGRIIGLNTRNDDKPIKIALTGDSAGGNFVATVCCRAIVEEIKIPDGLLMAYPVLDLNMSLFRAVNDVIDYKRNYTNAIVQHSYLPQDIQLRDDVLEQTNILDAYMETPTINEIIKNAEKELNKIDKNKWSAFAKPEHFKTKDFGPLTSRAKYFDDSVLPIKYMLLLGDAYIPTHGDPVNDMFLSPVRAPTHILSKFPTTRIHVGSVDPLSDDSRRFIKILKYANNKIDVKLLEWEGLSHAYIQCPTFLLPQARYSCELAVQWLSNMLGVDIVDKESVHYDYKKREKDLHDATDDYAYLRSRI